jgi:hypothetical protein
MSSSDIALNTCGLPCGSAVILRLVPGPDIRAYLSQQQSAFGWPHHTHYAHNMIRLDNLFISSTYRVQGYILLRMYYTVYNGYVSFLFFRLSELHSVMRKTRSFACETIPLMYYV